MTRVLVVGAGVIGLSAAVRAAEAGHDVHVLARDLPLETTSGVAAALWYPYLAAPVDRVTAWAGRSYEVFAALAQDEPEAGVRLRWGRELLAHPSPDPQWRAAVPVFERLAVPPAGYADGWRLPVPVIDMSRYLPWLVARLTALGGTVTRTVCPRLPSAPGVVVVNATGLAARGLAQDPSVRPVRGQVLRVRQPGIEEWTLDESDAARPLYVVPRIDDVVVGGTADDGSWDRTPDPATTAALLARAVRVQPALAGAEVVGVRVGLRPARPTVRLEVEHRDGPMIHCYGHGGAGVTLSWGCADEVATLLQSLAGAVAR